jgi:tRNA (guanine-N7-)-methyltransferase
LGSKNKLKRFNENESFKNVIQPTREEVVNTGSLLIKGKWHSFFGKQKSDRFRVGLW